MSVCLFYIGRYAIPSIMTDTFSDDFGGLLHADNATQAFDVELYRYLEDYSKRLQESLSTENGFSKLNFTEPAFIVSKAAKVWGRKVDSFDEFLHNILQRTMAGNKESAIIAGSPDFNEDGEQSEDGGRQRPDNVPKKPKHKVNSCYLDDLKTSTDILRPVSPVEKGNGRLVDLDKNACESEPKHTLRPRINFDLHTIYRLPISIQIKNASGDVMGDYCDFYSNTFDIEHVKRLLSDQAVSADKSMEVMETNTEEDNIDVSELENDVLYSEPVRLEADSEPVANLCPNLMNAPEEIGQASLLPPDFQPQPTMIEETGWSSMPGLEPQSIVDVDERQDGSATDVCREHSTRNRTVPITVTNKFLTRLDPYDNSSASRRIKSLSKTPGKPYKLPAKQNKESAHSTLKLPRQNDDLFSQHMPMLKPPPQIPNNFAVQLWVDFSEQLIQKMNDDVLLACGRKSLGSIKQRGPPVENDVADVNAAAEEVVPGVDGDDDNSSVDDAGEAEGDGVIDLPGLPVGEANDQFESGEFQAPVELPPVQDLEELLPAGAYDESRIKRVQEWDRYVESRLAAIEAVPFDVNEYCTKLISSGQKIGKRKWFSLDQVVLKFVNDKEGNKNGDPDKLQQSLRREGCRSLVSLLFLANSGNMEFKGHTSDLEVRLLSDTFGHIDMDAQGIELPHRAALSVQDQ